MKKRIRVLQIGMSYAIGGTETYLIQQYRNIDKSKLSYDFVNINSHKVMAYSEEITKNGDKVFNICARHKNPFKHYFQWIMLMIKESKNYHAITLNSNSLEYVFPLLISKLFKIPIRVIHSHNAGYQHEIGVFRKLLVKFNSCLVRWCATDYFACSSKAGKWMFGKNVAFRLIHNAIDVNRFKYRDTVREAVLNELGLKNSLVLGHIGRFDYQKNHEFLIKIFYEFQKFKSNSVLLLVGIGDNLPLIKRMVEELGIKNKVIFLGYRDDIPKLMQAIDIFLLPSRFEGLPLVGIEAQAAGVSCFFSNAITDELGITYLAHYISLKETPKFWAECILNNISNHRRDMSKEIRQAGYDINEEIKNIENFYTE